MKQKRLKPNRVEIGINPRLNKPAGSIEFKRIDTNLTDLILRRSNEFITLSLKDEELIKLKKALFRYFGY